MLLPTNKLRRLRVHCLYCSILCVAVGLLVLGPKYSFKGKRVGTSGIEVDVNMAELSPISQTMSQDTTVKVLILAYFRSGSTFTSEVLTHLNNSFFLFEPLHAIQQFLLETRQELHFLNGTTRPPMIRGSELSYSVDLIQSLLNCEFERVDIVTLTMGFLPKFSWQLHSFRECYYRELFKGFREGIRKCLEVLRHSCKTASVRVVKTIRLSMDTVEQVIDGVPGLKVIHLIRDPRGQFRSVVIHSRKKSFIQREFVCNSATRDIKLRQQLEIQKSDTFKEVIYEDLAQNPVQTSRAIYGFIGLPLPNDMIQWLKRITSSASAAQKEFGTERRNSTRTAYEWVKRLSWKDVNYFQSHCLWLLKHGSFPIINSEDEMKTFEIPYRPQSFLQGSYVNN